MIRYTLDNWCTWTESRAIYDADASSTIDSHRDTFNFFISFPSYFPIGTKCQFCIRYRDGVDGNEYWDNNDGKNYIIEYIAGETVSVEDGHEVETSADNKTIIRRIDAERSIRQLNAIDDYECRFY